ncbi:hypothetical protein F2P56_032535 [Juglans regia]|uniref:Outer envelope pore protein 16, chloroplastic-like n=1 Tax=Juglans regia TaxID=51240 RepID=A0A833SSX9_JUGRE|nr:hypothetical protein F2P56_032535 [Juglans regia]KAF5446942.1 hypothetical protein F2P56_032535 [Juglans regia]
MPRSSFSGSVTTPKVDVAIDMGNPFLNLTVDGFLKIGTVAATRAAAEDAYHVLRKGNISKHNLEHTLKKMCKEGAYWGTVAGVYLPSLGSLMRNEGNVAMGAEGSIALWTDLFEFSARIHGPYWDISGTSP